jgi:translocator protein
VSGEGYVSFKQQWLTLVWWRLGLMAMSAVLGAMTANNITTWYAHLNHSMLRPPNEVFASVWLVLYSLMSYVGWLIWKQSPHADLKACKFWFLLQLLLNWSWTPLFFYMHYTGLALLCMLGLLLALSRFLALVFHGMRLAFWLMVPYFLWLLFALYLNYYIWFYN